jgi:hypothetical protein
MVAALAAVVTDMRLALGDVTYIHREQVPAALPLNHHASCDYQHFTNTL